MLARATLDLDGFSERLSVGRGCMCSMTRMLLCTLYSMACRALASCATAYGSLVSDCMHGQSG